MCPDEIGRYYYLLLLTSYHLLATTYCFKGEERPENVVSLKLGNLVDVRESTAQVSLLLPE